LEQEREKTVREIRTEIEIDASPEYVWGMLIDFNKYPRWNPLIHSISGNIKPGARVEAQIGLYDFAAMTVPMKVIEVSPNRALRLRQKFLLPALFDIEYVFTIEPISPNQVRLIQQEIFSGLLAPFLAHGEDAETKHGLEALSQTVKVLAEHGRFSKAFG
jgi:hypothetical protein